MCRNGLITFFINRRIHPGDVLLDEFIKPMNLLIFEKGKSINSASQF